MHQWRPFLVTSFGVALQDQGPDAMKGRNARPAVRHFSVAARHEAGHWLVATRYGFPVSGIHLRLSLTGVIVTLDRGVAGLDELKKYCKERSMVLLAGYLAEHVKGGQFDGVSTPNNWETNDQDHAKLNELIAILSNIDWIAPGPNERQEILNELWDETVKFLISECATLDAITAFIEKRSDGEVPDTEIRQLAEVKRFLETYRL
jgi:hypothetical protein